MTKKKRAPRKRRPERDADGHNKRGDSGDEDNVYDEIDRLFFKQDANLQKRQKRRQNATREVLSVDVDEEALSDQEDFSGNPEAIFQDLGGGGEEGETSDTPELTTSNQWGKKRSNFYGTSYVDKDFGGVHDADEAEILELEEEDARTRQRKMDAANALVDFDDFDVDLDDSGDEGDADEGAMQTKTRLVTLEEALAYKERRLEEKRRLAEEERFKPTGKERWPEGDEDDEVDEPNRPAADSRPNGQKRRITYEMMKNRGIVTKSRRKDATHSRVKKRRQFSKALIRRRSQVPDVRRELNKYDGEKRGIRCATIRSVKLS